MKTLRCWAKGKCLL